MRWLIRREAEEDKEGGVMPEPSIRHDVRDPDRNITFTVLAYRKLTDEEVHQLIWAFESMGHEIKPNHNYEIGTILGL